MGALLVLASLARHLGRVSAQYPPVELRTEHTLTPARALAAVAQVIHSPEVRYPLREVQPPAARAGIAPAVTHVRFCFDPDPHKAHVWYAQRQRPREPYMAAESPLQLQCPGVGSQT